MNGWHLKKEVTIGQILTLGCLAVTGIWWASSVETRFMHLDGQIDRVEEAAKLELGALQ